MTRNTGDPALPDARIRLDRLPMEGRSLQFTATPEQLKVIAGRMDVRAVEDFHAAIQAFPLRGGIRITGALEASVTQPCVVTMEPVTQLISEPLDRLFLPRSADVVPDQGSEIYVDIDAEDEPDPIDGVEVDLAPYLLEVLALAIDPYPRAPGAELPEDNKEDETPESPFAKLQELKGKSE